MHFNQTIWVLKEKDLLSKCSGEHASSLRITKRGKERDVEEVATGTLPLLGLEVGCPEFQRFTLLG